MTTPNPATTGSVRTASPSASAHEHALSTPATQELFARSFAGMAASVARPVFERFARIAMRRGFAAVVKEEVDADNNPCLMLRFIPKRGGQVASQECVFALKAKLAERMVEHAACHDPGKGWEGMTVTQSGLHSINHSFLEAGLEQFVRCALEAARAPAA